MNSFRWRLTRMCRMMRFFRPKSHWTSSSRCVCSFVVAVTRGKTFTFLIDSRLCLEAEAFFGATCGRSFRRRPRRPRTLGSRDDLPLTPALEPSLPLSSTATRAKTSFEGRTRSLTEGPCRRLRPTCRWIDSTSVHWATLPVCKKLKQESAVLVILVCLHWSRRAWAHGPMSDSRVDAHDQISPCTSRRQDTRCKHLELLLCCCVSNRLLLARWCCLASGFLHLCDVCPKQRSLEQQFVSLWLRPGAARKHTHSHWSTTTADSPKRAFLWTLLTKTSATSLHRSPS